MRATRVKPAAITGKASGALMWVKKASIVLAVALVAFIPIRYIYLWQTTTASQQETDRNLDRRPVQTTETRDPCDNIAREKPLTPQRTLTSGSDSCMMNWGVEQGGVILYDKDGKPYPRTITKDNPLGNSDFAAAWWSSEGPAAVVTVKYYR